MKNRNLVVVGSLSAVLAGLLLGAFQLELPLPWRVAILGILFTWLGVFLGLQSLEGAGRLGKAGLRLASLSIGFLLVGLLLGDRIEAAWIIFGVLAHGIPLGLILHGLARVQNRSSLTIGVLTIVVGALVVVWIQSQEYWPLWIETAVTSGLGLSWLLLGYAINRARIAATERGTAADDPSAAHKRPRSVDRNPVYLAAVLLPFAVIQVLVWREKSTADLCPAPLSTPQAQALRPPRPVIIDADMAHEDMHAILFLLQHPAVDVQAITVAGTGEAHCEPGVRHAQGLTMLHGRPNIPVACGREAPLGGGHQFPAAWREEVDNLYGLTLPENPNAPSALSAPELIDRILKETGQKVTLIAVGPLTNVAETLQANPGLIEDIEMIYIMGGAVEIFGNVGFSGVGIENRVAEWNIYVDPHAANLVFASGAPVTLVPLNATYHAPVTTNFYRCIQENHLTEEAEFVYDLLRSNYDFVASGGFQFWDSLTAAIMTDETLATISVKNLIVEEAEGLSSGQTRVSPEGSPVRVAIYANGQQFESLFLSTINGQLR